MKHQIVIGEMIGQYEIRTLLGKGGMGTVYLAFQANLKREVAFKILSPEYAEQGDYAERFVREAQTAASLEHAHIVPIFDYGTIDGTSFVVMRLLSGGTLVDRLKTHTETRQSLPSLTEIAEILDQLAGALDYAHSKGIIHRDIKASNVMFDNRGSAFVVDFGIAKVLDAASNLTQTGLPVGTPSYMAPELWNGQEITAAVDQYALGILIFTLITGHLPYEAVTPYAYMHKHLYEPFPLDTWPSDLPVALQNVLEKALAKRPEDRFASVMEFSKAFKQAIVGLNELPTGFFRAPLPPKPVLPTARIIPVSDTGTLPKSSSVPLFRQPLLLGIVVLFVLVVVLGVLLFAPKSDAAPDQRSSPAAQLATNSTSTTAAVDDIPQIALLSASATLTLTVTQSPTFTAAPTVTGTDTPTATATQTSTPTATYTPTLQPEIAAQQTFSAIRTATASAWTATPSPDAALTIAAALTELYSQSLTETAAVWTWTPTATSTFTLTPTITPTDTLTPTPTPSPTSEPSLTPTTPPTLTAIPQIICGVAPVPRLIAGQQGRNTFGGGGTRVRDVPRGTILYTLLEGEIFDTLEGPVCRESTSDGNLNWWRIRVISNGVVGWVPEGNQDGYWLEPYSTLVQSESTVIPAVSPALATHNTGWTPQTQLFNGVEMVLVPTGCFMMGSDSSEANERPPHEQCFDKPFWIDRTEVTNAQYGSSGGFAGDNYPREDVNWFDARDFCLRRGARLPTEAEWEYAARGPDSLKYPWGNSWNPDNLIWRDGINNQTSPVGSRVAGTSWVGALDMSGNVWEWTTSLHRPYPYNALDGRENENDTTSYRVIKGGSWDFGNDRATQASFRGGDGYGLDMHDNGIGFRCVQDAAVEAPSGQTSALYQLAFRTNRDGNWEIYLMDADGSNQTNLTSNPADDQFPAWSPDGEQIAFVSNRFENDDEVLIMHADGSQIRNLTARREKDAVPIWSPDGTEMAFVSARRGNWEVFSMGVNGGDAVNLSNNPAEDFTPAWSPDGSRILFHSNRDGNFEIYVMNRDGSNIQRLTHSGGDDFAPTWSPDGKRIAFQSNRDGDIEIYVMNRDGSNVVQLTSNTADDTNPDYSPDGTQIAFASNRDGNYEVYVMNSDGSNPVRLTNNPANDSSPAWKPKNNGRG